MRATNSRPVRAQVRALAGTFLPAALVAVLAYTAASSADDSGCDGFSCPSFGHGVIGVYAASTAPMVAVIGQLATAGLGAVWPSLGFHPVRLGLLGALAGWIVFGLAATTF